jgi:hypothetical protein
VVYRCPSRISAVFVSYPKGAVSALSIGRGDLAAPVAALLDLFRLLPVQASTPGGGCSSAVVAVATAVATAVTTEASVPATSEYRCSYTVSTVSTAGIAVSRSPLALRPAVPSVLYVPSLAASPLHVHSHHHCLAQLGSPMLARPHHPPAALVDPQPPCCRHAAPSPYGIPRRAPFPNVVFILCVCGAGPRTTHVAPGSFWPRSRRYHRRS